MYAVDQNATDDCEYTVKFKTDLVCVTGLPISGGWIFNIIFLVSGGHDGHVMMLTVGAGAASTQNHNRPPAVPTPRWRARARVQTCFGLYAIIGTGINFYKHRTCEFPNKAFWAELESLVSGGHPLVHPRHRLRSRGGG